MDREQAEAIVQRYADEAIEQGVADLTPEERAELDEQSASYQQAKAEWLRDERALADDVQQRQQKWGAAWEQVFRAAASAGSAAAQDKPPVEITWRDPESRA